MWPTKTTRRATTRTSGSSGCTRKQDKSWLLEARGKVVKIISFLLKSLPDEHNYKVVFMHRNLREIVASQNKMLSRLGKPNDLPDEAAVQLLTTQEKEAGFFLKRPQFEVLELNYADVLGKARAEAQRMAEFVGEPLDIDKMAAVVDKELYRNRA